MYIVDAAFLTTLAHAPRYCMCSKATKTLDGVCAIHHFFYLRVDDLEDGLHGGEHLGSRGGDFILGEDEPL